MHTLAVFLLVLLIASVVVAFKPMPTKARMSASRIMAKKSDDSPMKKLMLPAAILPMIAPVAAFAAEGTGRAFGVDDPRLILAALVPSFIIFPLYSKWASQQESDDFFDGYEKRRNG